MGNESLHFPRGQTASNGISLPGASGQAMASVLPTVTGLTTEATPYRVDLASARPVETLDHDFTNGGTVGAANSIKTVGSKQSITMRAVQASADITVSKLGLLICFSTTKQHLGVVAHSTYAAGDGVACKPIDNAFPIDTVIEKYDWFWVHEKGPCYVAVGNGKTLTVGQGVASGGSGLADTAAAGNPVLGTAQETITGNNTVSHDYALINVAEGIQDSAAA